MSRVLFRYTGIPLIKEFGNFTGHAGKWCWWCIADILKELGHEIVPLNWNNELQPGQGIFDAIFSIQHLDRLGSVSNESTINIIRLTASNWIHHNLLSLNRVESLNKRRGCDLQVRRLLPVRDNSSFDIADHILINGNERSKGTYPKRYWGKITTMNTCAANAGKDITLRDFIPEQREFLYHAGSGAIHKGLDLVLEAFARHPEWTLHITSNLRGEQDFLKEFKPELDLPNIHYHGWVVVQSRHFQFLLKRIHCFILPSCSEGQSPAVATCLTLGLYPIISRYTGIDLPEGCGIYLDELTIDAVEQAVLNLPDDKELLRQVSVLQQDALVKYSRETFRDTMTGYLREWLP